MALGQKTGGGSRRGRKNKRNVEVSQRLAELGCEPLEFMALVVNGDLPCQPCAGKGVIPYSQYLLMLGLAYDAEDARDPVRANYDTVHCPQCGGTGNASLEVQVRANMAKELLQYQAPKKRSVEVSAGAGDYAAPAFIAVPVVYSEAAWRQKAKIVKEMQS